jgi:hypothetical protein
MSNRALRAVALVVVLIIVAWVCLGWWGSDERRIKRKVKQLQELVTKNIGEGDLVSLNRAREITEIFADPFEFEAEQFDFRTRDRQSLAAGIHNYRSRAETIGMRVRDWQLDVEQEDEWRIDYVRLLEIIEEPTWGF